jgi:hypothetical protein
MTESGGECLYRPVTNIKLLQSCMKVVVDSTGIDIHFSKKKQKQGWLRFWYSNFVWNG